MEILKSYISEGEHQTQVFSLRVDDQREIARTLAAFANTDGGRLLIGVKDNGKIVGINPEEEFSKIQNAVSKYCKPELKVKAQIMQEGHKLILEVTINELKNKPVSSLEEDGSWKPYVRREEHTLLASKILIGVWKKLHSKTIVPDDFSEDEQLMLSIIKKSGEITLSQLYKETKLKKSDIDKLLIILITWDLVDINIRPGGTCFSIPTIL